MARELAGKVAIVTGGAAGLGEAVVRRFVHEGARVVIADVDDARGEALVGDLGSDALFLVTDVADTDQIGRAVDIAIERFGGLDVMFNNAGVSGRMFERFLDDDLADFDRILRINLLGVMAGTQRAARHMAGSGGGSVINTTSIGGIQAGRRVMTYRASKAAVIQFTASAAIDLGEYGIRVNAIAPGNIPTAIMAGSVADAPDAQARVAQVRQMMAASRPLSQEGTADDIAEAALYLAGDRSRYVTGITMRVDGGTAAGSTAAFPRPSGEGRGST